LRRRRRQSGSAGRRQRRRSARGLRTQAQLLKSPGIKLSRGIQAVGFLKLSYRVHCGIVPFSVGLPRIRAIFCKGLLDFGDAISSRSLLAAFPPPGSFRRFFPVRFTPRCGACRFLCCTALRLCRFGEYTQPRRDKQRQGQVGDFLQPHWVCFGRRLPAIAGRQAELCPTSRASASDRCPGAAEP
jgi:hypothetical protein